MSTEVVEAKGVRRKYQHPSDGFDVFRDFTLRLTFAKHAAVFYEARIIVAQRIGRNVVQTEAGYDAAAAAFDSHDEAAKRLSDFVPGKSLKCWRDPKDERVVLLSRDLPDGFWEGKSYYPFIVAFSAMLASFAAKKRDAKRQRDEY